MTSAAEIKEPSQEQQELYFDKIKEFKSGYYYDVDGKVMPRLVLTHCRICNKAFGKSDASSKLENALADRAPMHFTEYVVHCGSKFCTHQAKCQIANYNFVFEGLVYIDPVKSIFGTKSFKVNGKEWYFFNYLRFSKNQISIGLRSSLEWNCETQSCLLADFKEENPEFFKHLTMWDMIQGANLDCMSPSQLASMVKYFKQSEEDI